MTITVPGDYVYLDWAATAPLSEEAAQAMMPYLVGGVGNIALGMNANSLHAPGRAAFEAMELSRRQLATDLGASRPSEIVFTSGATEADNLALVGIAHAAADECRKANRDFTPRVITTQIEHDAVLAPVRQLARDGFEVEFLPPDRQGFISSDTFAHVLDAAPHETVLVSVQMANSEVGSIQAIAELAAIAHEHGALFHTDATQALGKVPLNLVAMGVDAASFSAHKVGGPKGVGALYLKTRTPLEPQMLGGGQEDGRRSTTQNVAGIAGFAAAVHAVVEGCEHEAVRERAMRDKLYAALAALDGVMPTVKVEPGSMRYLPGVVHVLVKGFESETLVLRLDHAGFGVSGGSACSSHSLEPSHVLRALGIGTDEAYSALRVSFGRYNQQSDLDHFVQTLAECIG